MARVNFTSPVGRLVMGSLSKPQTTDAEGKPLVTKSGPNTGQPRVDYYFALAIPKGTEQHWSQTEWGAKIWAVGHAAFPNIASSPKFAWKVTDGDSIVPNMKGKKPCDREGYPRSWVLNFSSGFAPRLFRQNGAAFEQILDSDTIKLGHYVQVNGDVDGNGSQQQPGVFINHSMVCFSAFGPEIIVGPDAASAGFGAAPLPPGASATPIGGFNPAVPGVPAVPGIAPPPMPGIPPAIPVAAAPARVMLPAANGHTYESLIASGQWTDALLIQHGMMAAPPLAPAGSALMPAVPAPIAPAPIPVMPSPAFLQVPGVPTPPSVAPIVPPPPAMPAARQMLPAANGASYEALIAGGWTDALLVQNGLMAA